MLAPEVVAHPTSASLIHASSTRKQLVQRLIGCENIKQGGAAVAESSQSQCLQLRRLMKVVSYCEKEESEIELRAGRLNPSGHMSFFLVKTSAKACRMLRNHLGQIFEVLVLFLDRQPCQIITR